MCRNPNGNSTDDAVAAAPTLDTRGRVEEAEVWSKAPALGLREWDEAEEPSVADEADAGRVEARLGCI
jgi:hypothetical protein